MKVWMPIYKRNENCLHHIHGESVSILMTDQPETADTTVSHGRIVRLSTEPSATDSDCDAWVEQPVFN